MRIFFVVFLLFSFSVNAVETKSSKPSENMSMQYLLKLKAEIDVIKEFSAKFKESPKSYCPGYSGPDESTCLREYLRATKIRSSTQVMLLATIAASTGAEDKNSGYSSNMSKILMLENIILIYEGLDVSQFHLAQLKAKTAEGKKELKLLKETDEKMMVEAFRKMEAILIKGISSVEENRSVANVEEWKKKKMGELKTRLENLKKINWKYPT